MNWDEWIGEINFNSNSLAMVTDQIPQRRAR